MPKKRKTKKKEPEKESYTIEVEDWKVDYHFGINTVSEDIIPGVYLEWVRLILTGRILSPDIEKAGSARIELSQDPQMDDHWTVRPTIISAKAIGWMEIPRGDNMLIFCCSIPSRSFAYIPLAVSAGKVKYASISGTKLKWRKGVVFDVSLSTIREEG